MKTPRNSPPAFRHLISSQLRTIIFDSGRTAYALGLEAGIDQRLIQRFLNEERDIRLETLDRLAEVLDLRLVETGRGRSRSKPARPSSRVNTNELPVTPVDTHDNLSTETE